MMTYEVYTYQKSKIDALLSERVSKVTALPEGKSLTDTVTFQDLVNMGIIVIS